MSRGIITEYWGFRRWEPEIPDDPECSICGSSGPWIDEDGPVHRCDGDCDCVHDQEPLCPDCIREVEEPMDRDAWPDWTLDAEWGLAYCARCGGQCEACGTWTHGKYLRTVAAGQGRICVECIEIR